MAACTPLGPQDDPYDAEGPLVEAVSPTAEASVLDGDCLSDDTWARPSTHPDLRLELTYDGPATLAPRGRFDVHAAIANGSTDTRHVIVMPGDGSGSGWREPTVSFEARVEVSPGCWQPAPKAIIVRCGVYDARWQDDLVGIEPGGSRPLDPLWTSPSGHVSLQERGRVRLRMLYQYDAGQSERPRGRRSSSGRIPMRLSGVAPFVLVSNEVEFTIDSPLRLDLAPRPDVGQAGMLRDLVTVTLRNASDDVVRTAAPDPDRLLVELRGADRRHWTATPYESEQGTELGIMPGDSVTLVGEARSNARLQFPLPDDVHGRVEMRARFRPYRARPEVELVSPWIWVDLP